jgi:hypothetical protein
MDKVGFVLNEIAWLEQIGFCLTGTAWNGKSPFWLDWSGLEWRKSVLACLEWPVMEEVSFGLTGIACNGGSWLRKLILA